MQSTVTSEQYQSAPRVFEAVTGVAPRLVTQGQHSGANPLRVTDVIEASFDTRNDVSPSSALAEVVRRFDSGKTNSDLKDAAKLNIDSYSWTCFRLPYTNYGTLDEAVAWQQPDSVISELSELDGTETRCEWYATLRTVPRAGEAPSSNESYLRVVFEQPHPGDGTQVRSYLSNPEP